MPIDARQLSELVERYWPVLVAFADRACEEAEDVVQTAFIKLAVEEPVPDNCNAWLFTVVKRLASNVRVATNRRRQREAHAIANQRGGSDGDRSSRIDAQNDTRKAIRETTRESLQQSTQELELQELLQQLEDRERELVVARVWGELSFEQLAELTGESKATVWRVYQSGIAKLKQVYRELEDDAGRPAKLS